MSDENQASGVEQLIERLREKGVQDGKVRGDKVFEESRRRAEERLDKARREADEILQQAREEAARTKTAGEEAVRLAVRDAILQLKSELVDQFSGQVRRLVAQTTSNEEFLKQLLLEITRRAVPAEQKRMEVLLPNDVVGLEQLRRNPEEVKEGTLSHYVLSVTGSMLREGVQFRNRADNSPGIRIRLTDDDLEIDLTDKAIAQLLLRHLLPRFRAMLEGIVQ